MRLNYKTRPCEVCRKTTTMVLDEIQVLAWQGGMLVQEAFPELSPDLRELLISGTHPACWDELWGDEVDE